MKTGNFKQLEPKIVNLLGLMGKLGQNCQYGKNSYSKKKSIIFKFKPQKSEN
jgi:hypothetical protein